MKDFFYHQYQAFMQQLTHPESPFPKVEDNSKVNIDGMQQTAFYIPLSDQHFLQNKLSQHQEEADEDETG